MTENIELTTDSAIDVDFDDWLAGGERKAHFVTLYGRADLIADIEQLEKQRVVAEKVAEEDRGLNEPADPNVELDAQIDALWIQLGASKREFRVSARTNDELKAIRDEVEVECKDAADTAADKARTAAKLLAKRLGVTAANDINAMVRAKALEASKDVIELEVGLRSIADSTTMKRGDDWVPVTREQMRQLEKKLGNSQLDALNRAYARARSEAPIVSVPK